MDHKSVRSISSSQRSWMTHSHGNKPPLTPAASPTERMLFQKMWVKRELVVPRVCLSNMLLDWLSPRMAVTERFVHVGIRAGYRCWIIYWGKKRKKSSPSLKVEDVYCLWETSEGWRKGSLTLHSKINTERNLLILSANTSAVKADYIHFDSVFDKHRFFFF